MSEILATVGKEKITRQDLDEVIQSMNPQQKQYFSTEQGEKTLVENIIRQRLLYLDSKEQNIDEEKEFNNQMEKVEKEMLFRYSLQKIVDDIDASDIALKKFYDSNKDKFIEPEQVKASHILVKDEDKANEAYKKIEEGESFEDVAKEYNETQGSDLGYFPRGKMIPEFEEVAFGMKADEVSKPVKSQFGYHIIKVYDKKKSETKNFDDSKEEIKNMYLNEEQRNIYMKRTDELKNKYKVEIK